MSAAGPLPPPPYPSSPNSSTNEDAPHPLPAAKAVPERVFAHIQDLQKAALNAINPRQSVSQLVEQAERALAEAKSCVEWQRPDLAFVDYLRACELVIQTIPLHRDYIHFTHDQHGDQKLALLQRKINSMDEQFTNIKKVIVANNVRWATQPKGQVAAQGSGSPVADIISKRPKPAPSPKPEKLHGKSLSGTATGTNGLTSNAVPISASTPLEGLSDRFAKLRGLGQSEITRPDSRASNSSRNSMSWPSTTSLNGYTPASSLNTTGSSAKPLGPREMPEPGNDGAPPRPAKLAIDLQVLAAMPKPPSPTYSPARNMQTSGTIAPPRHSARSLAGPSGRKPVQSSASSLAPNGSSTEYFPMVPPSAPAPVSRPSFMSQETSVSAGRLYDYLERYNILLIDFRSRDEFDQGHIYTRNIVCIEPLALQYGMSAEQLADKLVLSPQHEQELFHNRDQFDLVVYYDMQTRSETFLSQPRNTRELGLKSLHEALFDFNVDRPLQRSPIYLAGGLEAWIELIGSQALETSNTQAKVKVGRPLQRRPAAREGVLQVSRRRLKEYNPLDAEEEQKWRARAMSESVPETPGLVPEAAAQDAAGDDEENEELDSFPTIDEFNRRFPDAGSIGQQAPMRPGRTAPQPPGYGIAVSYPAPPAASEAPPTRPAPAAPRVSYTGVSDRAASQNTPTPRSSSQLTPYIPTKYLSTNLRLPRTGIYNFGSTCYMNATLQALSATTPLSILFLDDQYKSMVQKDNWKGSRGLLPEIYSNIIRSLWKGDVDYIKPTTFRTFCGRLNSMFSDPSQQQDAQEFFTFLIDTLHEDFNRMWSRTPLRMLSDQEEAQRERMPRLFVAKTEWGRYTHRENSYLTSLFYGQQSSRLQCPKCGATSTQYDPWALLQVEIPEAREYRLQDCLRNHFKDELLDDENQWTCPYCKVPRKASKKFTITRAPPFLVIQLKRFKTDPRTGSDQRKIATPIRFPLQGLDMGEFVLPPPSAQEARQIAAQFGADALKTDSSLTPPYIYDAYAVVRHHGQTTRSGHYTALVKDRARGCWRNFNDRESTDFQPQNLRPAHALDNDQAYMIFFQRRSPHEMIPT